VSGKITVALDATYAAYPDRTGIGIYSEKLIEALARRMPAEVRSDRRFVLGFRPGPYMRWARRRRWPSPFKVSPLLDPWLPVPRATLFHGLAQRLPEKSYPLRVVTLHERFPPPSDAYATDEFRQFMGRRIETAVRMADRIITVSNSVRQHLTDYDPSLADKTLVIHHGVEPPRLLTPGDMADTPRGLQPDRFFLIVGAVQARKNVAGVVMALKPLREFSLALAGGDGYGAEEIRDLVRREGMEHRVFFYGHVPHEYLGHLYSNATALVFPSFEEAFGLPILEAMSYGLPVITSDVSAMPEVAGDAAVLVDPNSVDAIREAMRRVAEDESLARELGERGRRRAAEFTWDRCAERTWSVYEELLRGRL
jgi:glycosyltransferase involved in cell wall biosynthesis